MRCRHFAAKAIAVTAPAVLTILLGAPAFAQGTEAGRGQGVEQAPRGEFDPVGIRQGAFFIYPAIEVAERYDSNIFATENDTKNDLVTLVRPEVRVESNWSRHSLQLNANSEIARFADFSNEDYEHYTFSANGRVDATRRAQLTGDVRYRSRTEERGSPDDVNGVEPTEVEDLQLQLGGRQQFNRVFVSLDGEVFDYDFDDVATSSGTTINNDDRDRTESKISARAGYEIQPQYTAFVQAEFNDRDYDAATDDGGVNRDSDGYGLSAGVRFDLTGVTQGEVFAGYREQDYTDATLADFDGLSAGGRVIWNVTRLTTVRGLLQKTVDETTTAGASSIDTTRLGVRVNHELRRNVLLNGGLTFSNGDYQGTSREDDTLEFTLGGRYLLNRHFSLGANYQMRDRDSSVDGSDYTRNQISVRLRAQL